MDSMDPGIIKFRTKQNRVFNFLIALSCCLFVFCSVLAIPQQALAVDSEEGEVGKKLANPLANLWALNFNSFIPTFNDGDINEGDAEIGATTIFQPILPVPLHGEGEDEFRMIVRPVIPFIWSTPVPEGYDEFDDKSGIGDIQLPFVFAVPDSKAGKWILGAGPVFEFPTATDDALGADQYSAGPAVAVGHKGKQLTSVLFLNWFEKIGEAGQDDDTDDTSKGTLLYSLQYQLDGGWQIGTNPTISYNSRADSGNRWNVPIGAFVGKTMKFGKVPVNIKLGVEYSAVSPDDFGQQAAVRLQVTPIIPGLVKKPLFGL
ncbi:MAG: transporter [Desulfobacterales bacterium]